MLEAIVTIYAALSALCGLTFALIMYLDGALKRDGWTTFLVATAFLGVTWPWTVWGVLKIYGGKKGKPGSRL